MNQEENQPPVEIQKDNLSAEALEGIIESYILREGTDYGVQEVSFDKKKEQIARQIDKKEIRIVFDFNTESVTLMTSYEWLKLNKKS
ncbi:YheU family protein [Bdellovibrio svalbardensis]|uniref:YheU family protein n=1 Tax=Bdellovibrio svalbardensis TaxID=2972972 RepID=A0ABT6DHM5_9BACT|nr:YheU family protein [Bdellovibrio svalbardensis]MDG0816298.1 YheU family protein [Bdellovibrio svalbardensis]